MQFLLYALIAVVAAAIGVLIGTRMRGESGSTASLHEVAGDRWTDAPDGEAGAGSTEDDGPERFEPPPPPGGAGPAGTDAAPLTDAALRRLSAFLHHAVEEPLGRALEARTAGEMRDEIEDALGAVVDLDFFLEHPPAAGGRCDLRAALDQVVDEFEASWDLEVRRRIPLGEFFAVADPEAFKDAVFLVLHNAGHFGADGPIDVTLAHRDDGIWVIVRDKGPGFSAEGLVRALDPFYSTTPGGLGMGLPHARKLIESQGGSLRLRNMNKGGAEVAIVLPAAD